VALRNTLLGILLLSLTGLGISGYLTWKYTTDTTILCFGSGGCDAVQHSPYASVAGIPVPLLGVLAYLALVVLAAAALGMPKRRETLVLGMLGISLAGVLFSAYLTYVEIFVIRALCTWCVISAGVMLATFLLAVLAQRQSEMQ